VSGSYRVQPIIFFNKQERDFAMTQAQLERAVCRATGESRDRVHRVGFQEIRVPKFVAVRYQPIHQVRRAQLVGDGK
jgi:hypothetical protein